MLDTSIGGLGLYLPLHSLPHGVRQSITASEGNNARLRILDGSAEILDTSCAIRHFTVEPHPNTKVGAICGIAFARNPSVPLPELSLQKNQPHVEFVNDPAAIAELIQDLWDLESDAPVTLQIETLRWPGIPRRTSLLREISCLSLFFESGLPLPPLLVGKPYLFHFTLFQSFYVFYAKLIGMKNGRMDVSVPDLLAKLNRRLTSRVPVTATDTFVATFRDSFRDVDVTGQVEDLTERGVSLITDDRESILPAGVFLPRITLSLGPGFETTLQGRVIHCEDTPDGRLSLKVNIENNERTQMRALFNFVVSRRYSTTSELTSDQYSKVWVLFNNSGYTALVEPDSLAFMQNSAPPTWDRLYQSRGELSRNVAVDEGGEALSAGLHLTRLFSRTWIVHHLAIIHGHQRSATPKLFGAMCDFLLQTDAEYVISYTKANESWSQKNYYQFASAYPDPNLNVIRSYDVLQFPLLKRNVDLTIPESVIVREANKWDRKRIARFLSLHLPSLECTAFDYVTEQVDLTDVGEKYKGAGLDRNRHFFIAEVDALPVAFVICESVTEGVNIWSLGNSFQIYSFDPKHALLPGAKRALVIAALQHYRRLGRPLALYFGSDEDYSYVEGIEWVPFEKTSLWVTTRAMIPRFREYNALLFGRIAARVRARQHRGPKDSFRVTGVKPSTEQ
ncbi:MAG TPA: hypothetical protein VI895_11070 [Bdellovibrionota bacterium]|nr:hypothetical protein [Bdellovibrionota bacterium]